VNIDDELEVYEHLLDTLRQTNRTLVALGEAPDTVTPIAAAARLDNAKLERLVDGQAQRLCNLSPAQDDEDEAL
jgi:hypothetical protein